MLNSGVGRARAETILPPLLGGLLILVALIGLIGTAIKNPHPHDIKVGLVGPTPATQQISSAFASNAPGAFQFTTYASEDSARAAIDGRSVDGALVLGPGGPRLIVASAAGDAVIGVISGAFTSAFTAQGQTVTVQTVRPFPSGDPHGLILFLLILRDLVSSGGPLGSQLLPDFYRWLAPGMPVGQLYSGMRGALYFNNAGIGAPIAVLSAWLAAGLVLMVLGELVRRRTRAQVALATAR